MISPSKGYFSKSQTYRINRIYNKTLFCFGMKLTDRQKSNVEKQIHSIMENVNYYETNYERDKRLKKKVKKDSYTDYPSVLTSLTDAKFQILYLKV